jgi:hypothetical protein
MKTYPLIIFITNTFSHSQVGGERKHKRHKITFLQIEKNCSAQKTFFRPNMQKFNEDLRGASECPTNENDEKFKRGWNFKNKELDVYLHFHSLWLTRRVSHECENLIIQLAFSLSLTRRHSKYL